MGTPQVDAELPGETLVLAATVLSVPALLGTVFEMVVLAATDRLGRRLVLSGSLLAMGLLSLLTAWVGTPALALGLAAWGTASGLACEVGQAALVSQGDPDRAMTRWGLAAVVGDLLGVLLVVGLEAHHLGWRLALALSAVLPLVDGLLLALYPLPEIRASEDEEEAEPFWVALRSALGDWRLLAWLLAATSCTLLDELVVVLSSLHLAAEGAGPGLRGLQVGALALGGMLGLGATERWLDRLGARTVLLWSCALTIVSFLSWLALGAHPAGVLLALLVGASASTLYPLSKAAAYARCPDRPGLVGALDHLFYPLDLAAPLLLGLLADRVGLGPAMLALLLQPILVGLITLICKRPGLPGGPA